MAIIPPCGAVTHVDGSVLSGASLVIHVKKTHGV